MLSFPPSPQVKVFVCRKPVDMRKSFGGLSGAVIDVVDHDPQSGHLFIFFNSRRTMMKALVWGKRPVTPSRIPVHCWQDPRDDYRNPTVAVRDPRVDPSA